MGLIEFKTRPEYFQATWDGAKNFEIRDNSDKYIDGTEKILLREWDGDYTGRWLRGFTTYVTDFKQQPGYVVFEFKETARSEAEKPAPRDQSPAFYFWAGVTVGSAVVMIFHWLFVWLPPAMLKK